MTTTTEVTQADLDAAASIYQNFRDHDYAKWVREGTNAGGDSDRVIQAFARHRLEALAQGRLEGAEAGVKAAIHELEACHEFDLANEISDLKPATIANQIGEK